MNGLIRIYLAGACKNEPDLGIGWRKEAVSAFRKIDKYHSLKSCVINPTDYFSYTDSNITDKQVKNYYMSQIRNCDVILANINESASSCGTCMEIQHAVDHKIPVVAFGNKNVYPWIANVDCDVVFDTMEEAIWYIKKYYMEAILPVGEQSAV